MKKNIMSVLMMLVIPTMHASFILSDGEDLPRKKQKPKKCSSYVVTQRLNKLCKEIDNIEKNGFSKRPLKPMDIEWQGKYGYAPQSFTVGGLIAPTDKARMWAKGYTYRQPMYEAGSAPRLPTSFDIRQLLGNPDSLQGIFSIQSQETFENCVANALTANLQFDWYVLTVLEQVNKLSTQNVMHGMTEKEAKQKAFLDIQSSLTEYDKPFSRLFLWYNAKEGNTDNIGISIVDAISAFSGKGCCLRKTWQYTVANAKKKPSEAAYSDALQYQVHEDTNGSIVSDLDFANLSNLAPAQKLTAIKTSLRSNIRGVMVGLFFSHQDAVDNFTHLAYPYIITTPSTQYAGPTQYGHCMLIVGYDDEKKYFTIRNSYGPYWADNGYCYASYDFITSDWVQDLWSMKRIKK